MKPEENLYCYITGQCLASLDDDLSRWVAIARVGTPCLRQYLIKTRKSPSAQRMNKRFQKIKQSMTMYLNARNQCRYKTMSSVH